MTLAINVIAMLFEFVAVVALANFLIAWPQIQLGVQNPVTLQKFFGWLNWPFAGLMGVPLEDWLKIGGIGALAPNRRADLARLGLRAMIGGLLACYLTATLVGMLI